MEHNRPAKCLILRAVLRDVSPMVIRVFSISDQVELLEFHRVFQAVLGWDGGASLRRRRRPSQLLPLPSICADIVGSAGTGFSPQQDAECELAPWLQSSRHEAAHFLVPTCDSHLW
jgi:hypothetical protein